MNKNVMEQDLAQIHSSESNDFGTAKQFSFDTECFVFAAGNRDIQKGRVTSPVGFPCKPTLVL